ncbi:MAG: PIN domain-containing protein [Gracilibacteraceae bacterium]|jgi:predicted nucleic acid-binding protein|nr:PIN domain-containing protein [Gracilibacteraceae bacterium]
MKILLDTNVVMDALQERQSFAIVAQEILRRGQQGEFSISFTANAVTDIFYLYAKAQNLQSARSAIAFLLDTFRVVAVRHDDCLAAMKLPIKDFEDALVAVCAEKDGADYIVTRDEQFLTARSPVPLIAPKDFLGKVSPAARRTP